MYVIKLGGSTITDKNKPFSVNTPVIKKIAKVLRGKKDIVLVHGGGSFGHPLAKKYKLTKGYLNKSSVKGYALTQDAMQRLNRMIVDILIKSGINAISYQTSASTVMKNNKIQSINVEPLKNMIKLGLMPVMYGDVVTDNAKKKFGITSGDMIIEYLTRKFNVKRVFFLSDVDGIYTADPKKDKNANHISKINRNNLKEVEKMLSGSGGIDVTGGMVHKIEHVMWIAKRGTPVEILKPSQLSKALKGTKHKSTVIRW
jgi:isopentenyl phosphate kinase